MAGDGCCCLGPGCFLQGQGGISSERALESSPMDEYQSQLLFYSAVEEDNSSSHLALTADENETTSAVSRSDQVGPSHHLPDMAADAQLHDNEKEIAEAGEIQNSSLIRIPSMSESDYDWDFAEIEEPGPSHQVAEMVADAYDDIEMAIAEAIKQSLVDSTVEVRMGEVSAQGLVGGDDVEGGPVEDEIRGAIESAMARDFAEYITEDEIAIASALQDFMDDDDMAIAAVAVEGWEGERGGSAKGAKRKHSGEGSSRSTHGRHV